MLTVGFDARLAGWPGIGRYIRDLLAHLPGAMPDGRIVAFCETEQAAGLRQHLEQRGAAVTIAPAPRIFTVGEQLKWRRIIDRNNVDVFFSPHLVVPLLSLVPTVVAVHDLVHLVYPRHGDLKVRLYFSLMLRAALAKSASIVAVSEFTRNELVRVLGVERGRVRVIHTATAITAAAERPGRARACPEGDRTRILYVGTRKPWKNLETLLSAFSSYRRTHPSSELLIAGKRAANREIDVEAAIDRLGLKDSVTLREDVPEDELIRLYETSRFLVCPSYYEGFGLPAIEAAALGCPVLAGRGTVYEETLSGSALFFDPHDAAGLAAAMGQATDDPDLLRTLRERAMSRATRFSWPDCAAAYARVLSGAAGRR